MKYIVIIGDGMADYPHRELGNLTPLQYAKTPIWISWPRRRNGYGQDHTNRIPPRQ